LGARRSASGSSSSRWPTTLASETTGTLTQQRGNLRSAGAAKQWQTTNAALVTGSKLTRGNDRSNEPLQGGQAARFRTVTARDWKGATSHAWRNREAGDPTPSLPDQIEVTFECLYSQAASREPTRNLPKSWTAADRLTSSERSSLLKSLCVATGAMLAAVPRNSGRLNTVFVEWMMGLPPELTGYGCSATAWRRYRRRMRCALCGLLRDSATEWAAHVNP